jgi:hypothetical protein
MRRRTQSPSAGEEARLQRQRDELTAERQEMKHRLIAEDAAHWALHGGRCPGPAFCPFEAAAQAARS